MSQSEEWIYIGVRRDSKDRLTHWYTGPDGKTRGFSKPLAGVTHIVGGVYQFDVERIDEKTVSVLGGNRKFLRLHPDKDQRLQWDIEHKAETAIVGQKNSLKKLQGESLNQLSPIRDLYRNALPDQRRAILATVIEYITR